jgi:hypothetical protein
MKSTAGRHLFRHAGRRIDRAHLGFATTANEVLDKSGDTLDRFMARQRERVTRQAEANLRHCQQRLLRYAAEEPGIELRGSCGSDAHHPPDDE